ncbi:MULTISPECIES: coniferyl aldehyde dehydrogenase [unclassified Vibrio]|uniref:coniferyl aldehyde dehydrogenase n=1 Tax=unclassified Vibrio TaxID=2614977 RepID=UPI0013618AA1|nr:MULTISPECIES: coniferyl aldehyde dehydrogenase [unclassified Vibrio]NAW58215.1 aldehyde dehydrogenase family protein [Vibrio sp. V36_P2S2PM302]NAX27203.1 aldehyde dehydrogenase family protein [Vibrio sp. V38_P2S17PM301]NAX30152.1 aldehyde dehydrogenase family protein [Vibrio sp. V37_P2S8PM304]
MSNLTIPKSYTREALVDVIHAQRDAFIQHQVTNRKERIAKLKKLKAAVLTNRDAMKKAIDEDFGHRSLHETDILEFFGVVQSIDYMITNLKRFMKREYRHVDLFFQSGKAYVDYQPKGVVGIMSPWNYPFALTLIPLATALAAGNRAMIKPSELTPRTSALIKKIIEESFDESEVAVILGGPDVGAEFSRLPFDHLLFTGSTQVGHKIMQAASENLVPLTLELGGKSPVVMGKGQTDTKAISRLVFGKLSNGGQTCVAPDYALVHEDDLEDFINEYSSVVQKFYPNGPTSIDYTSIVSDDHYKRLNSLLEDAHESRTRIIKVGVSPDSTDERKRTIAPTLVIAPNENSKIMKEEIFGPILPVIPYKTMQEAIDYINIRPRPLALYYFGQKDADCETLLSNTTSGNVGINNTLMHVAQDDLPFGGIGPSGMGSYHGIEGFRSMSHAKGTYEQRRWNLGDLLHAPFGKLADAALKFTFGKSN